MVYYLPATSANKVLPKVRWHVILFGFGFSNSCPSAIQNVTGNFKMTLNLNNYHIAVLEYVDNKGDADLNEISHDLYHDIPKFAMHDTLNYVLAKNLLVKVGEVHPGLVYKLSNPAKQHLLSLRQNAYKQQHDKIWK